MAVLTDIRYDKLRNWIKDARENGVSWDSIKLGNETNEEGLKEFLAEQRKRNFWPETTVEEWYEIVESKKKSEQEMKNAEIRNQAGEIIETGQRNETNIPEDPRSSWQLYKKHLRDKGFPEHVLENIEKSSQSVLSLLSTDTQESGPVKGLVVGHVQSGKTANMAGVMAMAADYGWNIFIVLSGLVENLREQTQTRLINDLKHAGNISWRSLQNLRKNAPSGNRVQDFHFSNSADAHLYVCLKNKKRLENLLDWMQDDVNKYENMKVLVIDDEADQGSINTADVESEERKAINQLIVNLVEGRTKRNEIVYKKPKAMNYVSYTATPYANFLNEFKPESLYPKNFIKMLGTTNEYFGPKEIFGVEGHDEFQGLDIIREVSGEDSEQIINIHKGNSEEIPQSLKESIAWFLSGTASLKVHGYKKPLTMMIHASHKQAHHSNLSDSIRNWLENEKKSNILALCKEVWEKETERFTKEELFYSFPDYSGDPDKMYEYQSFHQIEGAVLKLINKISHIPLNDDGELEFHEHIHLCVDNSSNNAGSSDGMYVRLEYPDDKELAKLNEAPAFIVVGGTTLSRGLTMEGLISTYFLRGSKQADTLMQMGRWFGYRLKYELYPRIWMERDVFDKFVFLSTLEYELRETLEQFSKGTADPKDYGPRVKNTPGVSWMRVTAPDRQQSAEKVDIDFTGSSTQTILFNNYESELKTNIAAAHDFISSLGEGEQEAEKGKVIWRDVKFDDIANNLLTKMYFHEQTSVFNSKELPEMIKWVNDKTEKGLIDNWNVIVSGKVPKNLPDEKIWELPNNTPIGKVTRNRKATSKDYDLINIGVLRAPADLYADVQSHNLSEENYKELQKSNPSTKKVGEIRKEAGLQHTPIIIIYRIDKDSKSENLQKRHNLEAEEDLIGICLRIPGINTETGKSYGGLQMSIPDHLQSEEDD
ncbi:Z1 domain-containing protein [Salisediminibacterium halotolerans]|uniref:Z1 domain-containing protein n=1 Tax=Salisediminibacterium halotolerans TaxID=517425 RepID=A0A1H9RDS2_9BACI|nr:Z1 domain-containing protein [Salisediminibacterium haloalkalitolerans]SER70824.1 Z1 domain-containing protein [Salisediminibacterium haloalkalitolerans]